MQRKLSLECWEFKVVITTAVYYWKICMFWRKHLSSQYQAVNVEASFQECECIILRVLQGSERLTQHNEGISLTQTELYASVDVFARHTSKYWTHKRRGRNKIKHWPVPCFNLTFRVLSLPPLWMDGYRGCHRIFMRSLRLKLPRQTPFVSHRRPCCVIAGV